MRFVDPFNDLCGVEQVIRLLERMFEDATEVSFRMLDRACAGDRCFLRWTFSCRPKRWPRQTWTIEGVSMIRGHGRVFATSSISKACGRAHRHWDAASQVYGRMPLVGSVLRRIGHRVQLPPGPVVLEARPAVPEQSTSNR